ncbi:MAG: hypothetical protein WAL38_23555 [Solirubrobacteraceae bacterium]
MPAATAARVPQSASHRRDGLRCRVRLPDGRVFAGELAPERHRSLQMGLLHQETEGLVELAAGVRRDGRLRIPTRRRADHFLPGGRSGGDEWRQALLALAAQHADRGEEVFLAQAARSAPRGDKHAVCASRWLWVDVDQPGQLHALWAFLAERPCHLLVESGGSGGVHAYWKLTQPRPPRAWRRRLVSWSSRSSRPICASSTTSAQARTGGRTSRTRRARSARASCA